MKIAKLADIHVHYADEGPRNGPAVVFSNSLGTDFRLWDALVAQLPASLRLIRYDTRGHGLSDAPEGSYFMGDLVADAARLLDHLGVRECVFVGLSVGGMIAQGLAAERLDLVRAVVLSNTAPKIATPEIWRQRMRVVQEDGIEAIADTILERWFSRRFHETRGTELAGWRHMLTRTPRAGYIGCSAAIGETDLYESTARLRLPALLMAGSEDGSTPPDLVRETAALIPGARFHLIRGAGHLPCVEAPREYCEVLTAFLKEIGHV